MNAYKQAVMAGICLAGLASSAAAVQAQCNEDGEGRLYLRNRNGEAHPDGPLHLCLGAVEYLNSRLLVAQDLGGNRDVWILAGANGEGLAQDSYLCLSDYSDSVAIDNGGDQPSCVELGLLPFNYGGNYLAIYALGGDDVIHAGSGRDILFGDDGDDDLWTGYAGENELLEGGSGNDRLYGSEGSNTWLNGGDGDDHLIDGGGDGTIFIGGNGDDELDASTCYNYEVIDCGAGNDTLYAPANITPSSDNCESSVRVGQNCF